MTTKNKIGWAIVVISLVAWINYALVSVLSALKSHSEGSHVDWLGRHTCTSFTDSVHWSCMEGVATITLIIALFVASGVLLCYLILDEPKETTELPKATAYKDTCIRKVSKK